MVRTYKLQNSVFAGVTWVCLHHYNGRNKQYKSDKGLTKQLQHTHLQILAVLITNPIITSLKTL